MLYSKELIRQTMEVLRTLWGRYGYIYADIEPVIVPNFEEKTVDISFNTDLGNKISLIAGLTFREIARHATTLLEECLPSVKGSS